jgi:hypothetical protein
MTQNINIIDNYDNHREKLKQDFLVVAMMFASTTQAQETNSATNYMIKVPFRF